jgi:hypothetical protein
MRELARGEHVEPIHFRDNDFWHDFAEEFNAVAARVQEDAPQVQSEPERELVGAGVDRE